jgi:hypothetical protein
MPIIIRILLLVVVVSGLLPVENSVAQAPVSEASAAADAAGKEKAAFEAGVEAVIYGLPIVLMDITMQKTTHTARGQGGPVGVNTFAHMRSFPTAAFKDVVRTNVDTLYSSAFLDLSAEPMVLSVPDTHGRYYVMQMMDAWTNVFASPGSRTTGNGAGTFAITGPGWSGTLPAGIKELKSPTNMVWVLGRTQTNGPKEYPAVHVIQDGFQLVPLSGFGKAYRAARMSVDRAIDATTPPVEQLQRMSASNFFNALARLLKSNPPPAADAATLAKLAAIGVVPGETFDPAKLDPAVARGLERSVSFALERLQAASKQSGAATNGWRIPPMNLGRYGTAYPLRAGIAWNALGANLPADAVYPTTYVDSAGKALNGSNRYTLHFDPGQMPPVNAFWSVTMYDPHAFFVPNSINRYAISSWMPLERNKDGSVDLYIQRESPGKRQQPNWLPAADGDFNLTLRMYWPKDQAPSIIDGSWRPPAVTITP